MSDGAQKVIFIMMIAMFLLFGLPKILSCNTYDAGRYGIATCE